MLRFAHSGVASRVADARVPRAARQVSGMSINLCRAFPDANTLNLGGGYKVARMSYEKARAQPAPRACHPLHSLMVLPFATPVRARSWLLWARPCATRSWRSPTRRAARCARDGACSAAQLARC